MNNDEKLSILFTRLKWPSPLVRDRSCFAIAKLLLHKQYKKLVESYYLKWLKEQILETNIIFALLVLVKAKELNSKFKLPNLLALQRNIHYPSILSTYIINNLYSKKIKLNSDKYNSGKYTKRFKRNPMFKEHFCVEYLPKIYKDRAISIEIDKNCSFFTQWDFEVMNIKKRTNKEFNYFPHHGTPLDKKYYYFLADYELSEVYRSAYLRALSFFEGRKILTLEELLAEVFRTSPFDLGLWQISYDSRPPKWWEISTHKNELKQIKSGDYFKKLEKDFNKLYRGWILSQGSGIIGDYGKKEVYHLDCVGILSNVKNISTTKLEEIYGIAKSGTIQLNKPAIHLNGKISSKFKSLVDFISSNQNTVLPIAAPIKLWGTHRLQFWRAYSLWAPAPIFPCKNIFIVSSKSSVNYTKNKDVFAKWQDWAFALTELNLREIPFPSGEYLMIKKSAIKPILKKFKLKLYLIFLVRQYYRKYETESFKCNIYKTYIKEIKP